MKTLKKNEEYKRVPDSNMKDLNKIDKLVNEGWSFVPKKEWKNWKSEHSPKKEIKKTKRGKK